MCEKNFAENLKEQLIFSPTNGSKKLSKDEIAAADSYCEDYKIFLNQGKTERECAAFAKELAIKNGFLPFDPEKKYSVGDKIFTVNREKAIILAVIGKTPLDSGVHLAAAHIDSPRMDLKPNPLYEADEIAFFKTHYYGGIKKYQWTTIPLSLHGVVIKKDGTKVTVCIGEDDNDPQFCITDLLPHLADAQMKKPTAQAISGEDLNIVIGSRYFNDESISDGVKLNVMHLLNEKYGFIESDFLSAELELVPAFKARDIGFDRSLIGSYGHDDRVCAYAALKAIFDAETPEYTCVTILTDKEETGSEGNTGLNSSYLKYFLYDLADCFGVNARKMLSNSVCLSADVNAAFDPTFSSVYEKNNACKINYGAVITKYTGARGKSSTSDASAEFMYSIRSLLESKNVLWQTGELGKVDCGGGGTVAMYTANLNIDVVDLGVPVLSMHAPWEIVSKIDAFMTYRAILEFFNNSL